MSAMSSVPGQVPSGRETEAAPLLNKGENQRTPQLWEPKTGHRALRELSIQVDETLDNRVISLGLTSHPVS